MWFIVQDFWDICTLTAGGEGGRLDLGKIRFCGRSFELVVRLYEEETGGSGGERGLFLNSGDLCNIINPINSFELIQMLYFFMKKAINYNICDLDNKAGRIHRFRNGSFVPKLHTSNKYCRIGKFKKRFLWNEVHYRDRWTSTHIGMSSFLWRSPAATLYRWLRRSSSHITGWSTFRRARWRFSISGAAAATTATITIYLRIKRKLVWIFRGLIFRVHHWRNECKWLHHLPYYIDMTRDRFLSCCHLLCTFFWILNDANDSDLSLLLPTIFCPNNRLYWHVPSSWRYQFPYDDRLADWDLHNSKQHR